MPVTLDLGTLVTDSVLLLRSVNSSKEQLSREAADMFLEAASSFNVLLEKYRQSQITMTLSNPNMIYLIYTAAIAHLSGYKIRQAQQRNGITSSSASSTSALQTQLHLLKCLEALGLIGYTWELARRCWKALDGFMEAEHLKPKPDESLDENSNSLMLGKRKREIEEQQERTWQSIGGRIGSPATRGPGGLPPSHLSAPAQNSMHPNVNSPLSDLSTVMTPSPNSTPQFMSGFPPSSSSTGIGASGWEDATGISFTPMTNEELAAFDPLLFQTKWMPDGSQTVNAEWNNHHSWDGNGLSQSYTPGLLLFWSFKRLRFFGSHCFFICNVTVSKAKDVYYCKLLVSVVRWSRNKF